MKTIEELARVVLKFYQDNLAAHDVSLSDFLTRLTNQVETEYACSGDNLLRDALSWFDSHDVEKKLGHLPQWVAMARGLKE